MPAGWGTDHPGYGRCRLHGGKTRNHQTSAREQAARDAVETYGRPIETTPTEALLDEVRWTAGHVAWLRERVRELEEDQLVWGMTRDETGEYGKTVSEAKPNIWLELYRNERKHLVDVTSAAIKAGIEERRVRLAEAQGQAIRAAIDRILERLQLSEEQRALVPVVVPEEFRTLAASAN